jgi:hypothetical protein
MSLLLILYKELLSDFDVIFIHLLAFKLIPLLLYLLLDDSSSLFEGILSISLLDSVT